jgi:hypothetical protein
MYLNANLLNYGTSDVDNRSFNTHPNITQYCMQSTLKSFWLFSCYIEIAERVTLTPTPFHVSMELSHFSLQCNVRLHS